MLPAYGDGPLLREAVSSVLAQTDPRWRLTVVDDGIDLGRGPELAGWLAALGDDRVRYLVNEERLGINRNFQRCVDEATADLVVILGADDRLQPHYVGEVRAAAAAEPAATWIHPAVQVVDDEGRPHTPAPDRLKRLTTPRVQGRRLMGGERLATSLLHGNWMYFPSVAFRRRDLQRHGFRPGHDIVLDLDLYLRILLDGGHALLLERVCADYRRHSASLSSAQASDGARFDEESDYFAEMRTRLRAAGWPRAARAAGLHWTSRLHAVLRAAAALRGGQPRPALRMLATAGRPPGVSRRGRRSGASSPTT